MSVKFCVLGSGSDGNATLLLTPFVHVLIDIGFLPAELSARMDGTGASWETLTAVVLTHTHDDHVKKKCLALCAERGIQFWCHDHHAVQLGGGRYFKRLQEKGLLNTYRDCTPFEISSRFERSNDGHGAHIRFHPIQVPHDSPPTFGFRIEARYASAGDANGQDSSITEVQTPVIAETSNQYGVRWAKLGYLVDLGVCHEPVAKAVADVDLLALEFNHDERMERASGRHPRLIQRVLGKDGHLSNAQAADVFRQILEHNGNGGPKLLIQMHLSRDCNRPELAYQAAQQVLLMTGAKTRVFSTRQDKRGTIHSL